MVGHLAKMISSNLQKNLLKLIIVRVQLVYVIAWVAVVFGINCASNAGRKLVIVRGAAEHYYCFLTALREQLIPNTTATRAIIN